MSNRELIELIPQLSHLGHVFYFFLVGQKWMLLVDDVLVGLLVLLEAVDLALQELDLLLEQLVVALVGGYNLFLGVEL